MSNTDVLLDALVTESSLVLCESNTCDLATVIFVGKSGESTPATANIKQVILGLQIELKAASATQYQEHETRGAINLFADKSEFVVLQLLERLFSCEVVDDT